MSDVAIRVEDLSKYYRLGTIGGATLREDIQRWWAQWRRRPDPLAPLEGSARANSGDHWALRNVSFEVKQGQVLGIIGHNGAGKSTLLKILSRTTAPTSGRAMVRGRIGSLLEVGTGFHPELTGRENIYLNGAILGMRKLEIDRKLDEIIDFSGVERFIDTPVKRYSSGMYVRLAFAVAAHLEPEILVIDEVLAVGDEDFQRKCLGKMQGVAAEGRTVLFVSHNLAAVAKLCSQSLLLGQGQVIDHTLTAEVVRRYLKKVSTGHLSYFDSDTSRTHPHFSSIRVCAEDLTEAGIRIDKPLIVDFQISTDPLRDLVIGVQIFDESGYCVHHLSDEFGGDRAELAAAPAKRCILPPYALAPGKYWLTASLGKRNYQLYERLDYILEFEVKYVGALSDRTTADAWLGATGPGLAQWQPLEV